MLNGVNLDLRDGVGGASFDAAGRPTQWVHRDTNAAGSPVLVGYAFGYDAMGNKTSRRSLHDPNDTQRFAYDSAGRLTAFVRGDVAAPGNVNYGTRDVYLRDEGRLPISFYLQPHGSLLNKLSALDTTGF